MRCALIAAWIVTSPAAAQTDARAVVEKAIEAHGGAARARQFPAGKMAVTGSIHLLGQQFPFTAKFVYLMPDRLKQTVETSQQNVKQTIVQVQSGDKVQVWVNGQPQPLTPADVERYRRGLYIQNLLRLAPLVEAPHTLTLAGELEKLRGVKVSAPGQKDVTLYFDPQTHLLMRVRRTEPHPVTNKDALQEEIYSDYKDTPQGLKYPAKSVILLGNQKYIESTTGEYTPMDTVEASEFQGP